MKKQTTRLRFSDTDLENEAVKKAAEKAEKAAGRADEAKARLPSSKLRTKKASTEAEGAKLRFGKKEIVDRESALGKLDEMTRQVAEKLSAPERRTRMRDAAMEK